MPIRIPDSLPATATLESENIFVMTEYRALHQDIRPLKLVILNLMPTKITTETQILRKLSNTPLQIDVELLQVVSHDAKHTSEEHLESFYRTFDEIKNRRYDGMIITGAPVEMMEFEEVNYWEELSMIMEWSKKHVTSTLHICWGAQAGLYYHYGIQKYLRESKLSGIYSHKVLHHRVPLMRSMDDYIMAPHSRYTEVRREDVEKHPELIILAESDEAGLFLIMSRDGRQICVQGHPEYYRMTLDGEYHRDLGKGINPQIPCNYYENDDPTNKPVLCWRNMANPLYRNWLNYYVYQETPFQLQNLCQTA